MEVLFALRVVFLIPRSTSIQLVDGILPITLQLQPSGYLHLNNLLCMIFKKHCQICLGLQQSVDGNASPRVIQMSCKDH